MFHSYTESEHQKYFPCLFASQLSEAQSSKIYLLFLYKIFVKKELMGCKKINGQKFHERKKKKDLWFIIKISRSNLEESFQVKEH